MPRRARRLCDRCGQLYQPPRCPCRARARRPEKPRVSGWQRYNAAHRARRQELIDEIGHCQRPGGCPHPDAGTARNPLVRDHLVPKRGRVVEDAGDEPDRLLCRRCNSERGAGRW